MRLHRRGVGFLLLICAVGLTGVFAVSCGSSGSGSTTPLTGIRVHNNATHSGGPNIHVITRVDIGGSPATVHITPGSTLFMPTAPGSHVVDVVYSDLTFGTGQTPPDPVVVGAFQSVLIDFVHH